MLTTFKPSYLLKQLMDLEEHELALSRYHNHLKLFKVIEKLHRALEKGNECLRCSHDLGDNFLKRR